jgi:hypothetical protein
LHLEDHVQLFRKYQFNLWVSIGMLTIVSIYVVMEEPTTMFWVVQGTAFVIINGLVALAAAVLSRV